MRFDWLREPGPLLRATPPFMTFDLLDRDHRRGPVELMHRILPRGEVQN